MLRAQGPPETTRGQPGRQLFEDEPCTDEGEHLYLEPVPAEGDRIEHESHDRDSERHQPQRMNAAA